jgi:hypothetical protein
MFSIRSYIRRNFFRKSRKRLKTIDIKDKFVRIEHLQEWKAGYENKIWEMEARLQVAEVGLLEAEMQLTKVIRQFQATQHIIALLLASTPRPDVLLRDWHRNIPELIDSLTEDVPPDGIPPHLQEPMMAWQLIVQRCTSILEQAAAYKTSPGDRDRDE